MKLHVHVINYRAVFGVFSLLPIAGIGIAFLNDYEDGGEIGAFTLISSAAMAIVGIGIAVYLRWRWRTEQEDWARHRLEHERRCRLLSGAVSALGSK